MNKVKTVVNSLNLRVYSTHFRRWIVLGTWRLGLRITSKRTTNTRWSGRWVRRWARPSTTWREASITADNSNDYIIHCASRQVLQVLFVHATISSFDLYCDNQHQSTLFELPFAISCGWLVQIILVWITYYIQPNEMFIIFQCILFIPEYTFAKAICFMAWKKTEQNRQMWTYAASTFFVPKPDMLHCEHVSVSSRDMCAIYGYQQLYVTAWINWQYSGV